MQKQPLSLVASFILGAVFALLLSRVALGRPTPANPQKAASSAATTNPSRPNAAKPPVGSRAESAATKATVPASDPSTWLKNWVAAGAPADRGKEVMPMVVLWTETDARGALEFIATAPRFPLRLKALVIPLTKLGLENTAFVIDWMTTHLTVDERTKISSVVATNMGKTDPSDALEFAFAPGLPIDGETFASLIADLARTQPVQALNCFNRLSAEARKFAAKQVTAAIFKADRETAVTWSAAQRGTAHGPAVLRTLIETAAATGPEQLPAIFTRLSLTSEELAALDINFRTSDAALVMLPFLPVDARREAVEVIVRDELQGDPALALKLAQESLPTDLYLHVVKEAWNEWRYSDARAARSWAESLVDLSLKSALLEEIVDPLLQTNPALFLAQTDQAEPGSRKAAQINLAIKSIARADPKTAAAWVDRLPQTVAPRTVREVASSWLERDESAAWLWISSLPPSTLRDSAAAGAIQYWANGGQISQATAALGAISDARRLTAARWSIAQSMYLQQDSEATRRWIETQPMSQEVRESWLVILEE